MVNSYSPAGRQGNADRPPPGICRFFRLDFFVAHLGVLFLFAFSGGRDI